MKQFIKKVFNSLGYNIHSTKYQINSLSNDQNRLSLEFDHVLAKHILENNKQDDFSFIQVGAFDGIECDPLRKYLTKYSWRGILIEPQPIPFGKLQLLYKDSPNITLVQAAVNSKADEMILYTLNGDDLPNWSKGMASFDKSNILKHINLIPNIENYILPLKVEAVTFKWLLDENKINNIDLLQIDTEGYDGEIIKMFPFEITCPKIIHFEYKHIPLKQLNELILFLINKNYSVAMENGEDMLALHK